MFLSILHQHIALLFATQFNSEKPLKRQIKFYRVLELKWNNIINKKMQIFFNMFKVVEFNSQKSLDIFK